MARLPLDHVMRIPHDPHRWDRSPSLQDLKPADIAKTLMSFATVRQQKNVPPPTIIIDRLCDRALKVVDSFSTADIAALFRSLATLRHFADPRLLKALSERAVLSAKSFKASEMADLFWSFPSLGLKMDRTLSAALSCRVNATISHYIGRPAVITLWAVARMQWRRELGLIHGLVTQIQKYPEKLAPMDVGLVMWSFAALGIEELTAPTVQELVNMSMEQRINEFGPTDVSGLLRSMVLCGYEATKEELGIVSRRALMLVTNFEASATSMFLWSIAMLKGTLDFKLREEMKLRVAANASLFSFYELGDVNWACWTLDIPIDPPVWTALWKKAQAGVSECDSTSLSNLLFAHAVRRMKPEQALLDALRERAMQLACTFEADELSNIIWAFGAIGCEVPETLAQLPEANSVPPLKNPCYRVNCKDVLISIADLKKKVASERQELFV